MLANLYTLSAANALFGIKHKLGHKGLALRIVAPDTGERTALKKYSCTDAGTVMDRVFLYIEYSSCMQIITSLICNIDVANYVPYS